MLNPNHKTGLRSIFHAMDNSLSRALEVLDSTRDHSPFSELVPDATPVQRKVVADYVSRIRAMMREVFESQDMPLTGRRTSAIWSARMAILSANITLEDLHPSRLRGYGEIGGEDAEELIRVKAKIDEVLGKIEAYLAQGPGADLGQRLERIAATADEIDMLRRLERVVTRRGLIEFRGSLEMLLDRIEATSLEVAVFGRVSSGKSSLLNYVVETDVLPVGVTPITAIPTRIRYGPAPRATIEFAEAQPYVTSPAGIAQFASEQLNPRNAKHVTRIEVELPAQRLRQGITLVDTPGIGSLAVSGAAESMAYLPRCDVGVVLVDAASTLVAEDVALVDLLHRAGATVQVLLSKSDLLGEAERRQAATYVRRQLRVQTGIEVPVVAVSVRGAASTLCDRWLAESLLPAFERHQELAEESIRRKTGALREAVVVALRAALNRTSDRVRSDDWHAVEASLVDALSRLETAMRQFDTGMTSTESRVARVLDETAGKVAERWAVGSSLRTPTAEINDALRTESQALAGERIRVVQECQAFVAKALQDASETLGMAPPEADLVSVADVPLVDIDRERLNVTLERSWRCWFGTSSAAREIRKQLDAAVGPEIGQMLDRYSKALNAWCRNTLHQLQRAFRSQSDFYRGFVVANTQHAVGTADEIASDIAELETDSEVAIAETGVVGALNS